MPIPTSALADEQAEPRLSLGQRWQLGVVGWVVPAILALIGCTLRVTFSFEEGAIQSIDDSELHPGIFPFWHRCVLPAVWIFRRRNLAVFTSRSRDGEYIARVIHRFGFVPVRGSSSRGGQRGLLEMRRLVTNHLGVAFTIDGPRGPRYVAKRGPVLLARITGVPITCFLCRRGEALGIEDLGCDGPSETILARVDPGGRENYCAAGCRRSGDRSASCRNAGCARAGNKLRGILLFVFSRLTWPSQADRVTVSPWANLCSGCSLSIRVRAFRRLRRNWKRVQFPRCRATVSEFLDRSHCANGKASVVVRDARRNSQARRPARTFTTIPFACKGE